MKMKKSISMFLAVLMVLSVIVIQTPQRTEAATATTVNYSALTEYKGYETLIPLSYNYPSAKVTKIKSTKPSVAAMTYNKSTKKLRVKAKKAGTTTLSCTITSGGKTYNWKCKFTVLNYNNIFSSIKIGGKEYKSEFDKYACADFKTFSKKTLKVKLKSGWTLQGILRVTDTSEQEYKNGAKATLKKNDQICITAQNKKGNTAYFYIMAK